ASLSRRSRSRPWAALRRCHAERCRRGALPSGGAGGDPGAWPPLAALRSSAAAPPLAPLCPAATALRLASSLPLPAAALRLAL
ncbi:MAG: hypothetical protein AVDCRST_MAG27-4072, partial [uncultured Craurococcus sp.]